MSTAAFRRTAAAIKPQADTRHMKVTRNTRRMKMPSIFIHKSRTVKPSDRIKYWNIHPGDEVQVGGAVSSLLSFFDFP
jgi:hypothetical protein